MQRGCEFAALLLGPKQPGVFDRRSSQASYSLQQGEVFFGELVGIRVDQRNHPDNAAAIGKWSAHRRAGFTIGFLGRSAHPALIIQCAGDQRGFFVLHHPAGQPAFEGFGQLFAGVVVHFAVHCQRALGDLPVLVQHQDAAALGPHVLHGQVQHPLQQHPQIQVGSQLAADLVQQIERGAIALGDFGLNTHDRYFNPVPVLNSTMRSSDSTQPRSTRCSSPARLAAPSGQVRMPSSRARRCCAARI